MERNEEDHAEFKRNIAVHYRPEQLVFTNESHFNRLTLRRPHAWAKHGERALCHVLRFDQTSLYYADTSDCFVSLFPLFLTPKPVYDTI